MEEYQQPMNIFIIGDSWGVPNYNSEFTNCHFTDHTEYQLQQLGHKVFNFSLNGSCMVETIEYARSFVDPNFNNDSMKYTIQHKRATYDRSIEGLKNVPVPDYKGERIDWIVWFHTEAMRGILQEDRIKWVMLEELHDMGTHMSYRAFVNLLKFLPNVKTAVIGGQAPVNKLLYEYHKPNFIIEDWRSEIVGRKLPRCISLSRLNMVERLYDSKEEKIKIMDVHNEIFDAMKDKELFFDMCHPGPKPHHALAKRLHEEFLKGK